MVSMVVYALELLMTIEKHVFSFCDIHLSTKIRQLTYANQQPTKSPSFGGGAIHHIGKEGSKGLVQDEAKSVNVQRE
jgi:hypothetical protein